MNTQRIIGIALFVIGVALIVLGAVKIAPSGTTSVGASLCFFGILLAAFSFIRRPEPGPDAPPPMSPAQRLLGMFYEPTRVFQNLRAYPRWLAPLLVIGVLAAAYTFAFERRVTPEAIGNKMADKIIEGGWVPEGAQAEFREQQIEGFTAPMARVGKVINAFVGTFAFAAFLAGIYLLGALVFGGRINFWQGLAVALHAMLPVVVIQRLLSLLLLYIKPVESINLILDQGGMVKDNLGVIFSPAEHPVLFAAGSTIGLLSFYGVWLGAKGLRHGGERVSSSAAWSISIGLWLLGFLIATGSAVLFPQFLS
jgi:hypothetical protein